MMELIMEKGYDEISIQDVTDKANLGRATFYLHYKEKDDLLTDLLDQLFKNFAVQGGQLLEFKWAFDDEKILQKVFTFAEANYDFYRIMIFGKGGITASRTLQQSIANSIQQALETEISQSGSEPVLPLEFISNHLAGELLSCVYWWLDNDMPFPPDEMARMYHTITGLSSDQLLQLPEPKNIISAFIEGRREKSRERRNQKKGSEPAKIKDDTGKPKKRSRPDKTKPGRQSQDTAEIQPGTTLEGPPGENNSEGNTS